MKDTHRTKKRKLYNIVTLIVFCLSFLMSILVVAASVVKSRSDERDKARTYADSIINNLVSYLKVNTSVTDLWKSVIILNQDYTSKFKELNDVLLYGFDVDSVCIAPDGIVRYVYPASDSSIQNLNLFADENTRDAAEASRNYRSFAVFMINETSSDNAKIMYCNPVFLNKDSSQDTSFWGFVIAIIDIPSMLDHSGIQNFLSKGYDCRLVHKNYLNGESEVIFRSTNKDFDDVVSVKIPYVSSDWILEIYPSKGEWTEFHVLLIKFISALAVCVLLSSITYLVLYLQDKDKILTGFSYTDTLTGLGNSRNFLYYLGYLVKNKKPYGVIYMDLNDFKPINDNFGHNAGDKVLSIVGKRLNNCIRGTDSAYRIGGDEYAIIVEGFLSHNVYDSMVERIKNNIVRPIILSENKTVNVGISVGYAISSKNCDETFDTVVKLAEALMYKDKKDKNAGR